MSLNLWNTDESDTSPQNEGFIVLFNIQFGLLNHSCQICGKPFFVFLSILAQTRGLLFKDALEE